VPNPFIRRREVSPEWGEAMKALPSDRWRSFVEFYLLEGPKHGAQTRAARAAGFGKPNSKGLTISRIALRLMSDLRIQAAIAEEARKLLRAGAPEAAQAVLNGVRDPTHRDHARFVSMLLDRSDTVETYATVHHTIEVDHNAAALEQLALMKRLNVARERLEEMFGHSGLSRYEAMLAERDAPKRVAGPEPKPRPPVIDADAVEVVKPATDRSRNPENSDLPGDRW
jgi:hypothetical protein